MKKIILSLAYVFPAILFAQNVAINTDGSPPNSNAILDIKSESKGLLMPRLTTAQRTGIVSAVPGLTVFDSETFSYWVYRGELNGGWAELLNTIDKHWDRTGSTVFNTNPGNVGIGTNNPTQKLAINATDPTIDFMNAGTSKGYLQANGSNMRIGTYANNSTGNLVFNTNAVDRMWIDETGKVGIGTSSPSSALTINGTNPWLEMKNGGVDKGFLWASGNDLKLGTNVGNTTGKLILQTKLVNRLVIDENGFVGIGTNTPSTTLTINGTDPLLQFQNTNVNTGYIQLIDDDIKIGTNAANNFGKFIVRTNGADRLTVSSNGNVGIGTVATNYSFDVNGYSRFSDHLWVEGLIYNDGVEISKTNYAPSLKLKRTDGFLTYGSLEINDNLHLVLSKGSNGGGIIIDANTGSGTKRFYASKADKFNFGTGLTPPNYIVSVEGKMIATDFTALAVNNWPDYVFADDYKLTPLQDVKKFIAANKHLPNIPAASEIEKNGIQLGDMNKRLMEKVEELTLYVIDMQEQIEKLKKNK